MPSFPISEFQKKDNGSETNVEKLLCLTQEEKTMFEYLKENNYRLEQEKIPYEYISSRIPE